MNFEIFADETHIKDKNGKEFLGIGCLFVPTENKYRLVKRLCNLRCLNENQKSGHGSLVTAGITVNIMALMILKFTLQRLKTAHQRLKSGFIGDGLISSPTITGIFKIRTSYCTSIFCIWIWINWTLIFLV